MDQLTPSPAASSTASCSRARAEQGAKVGPVLVTGVGGIVGQGVLKSLAGSPHRLVGTDASEWAAGLYAAPRAYLTPPAKDPVYVDRLLDICRSENVRFLFPGLDVELPILARAADRFRSEGIVPVVSSPGVVDLADDKLETIRFLKSRSMPAPRTQDLSDGVLWELGLPLVLKPRKGGSRSQGVYTVRTEEELSFRLKAIDCANYVAQEYIGGQEYTCGTLTFDGKCHGVIVMMRTLRDGDTHKAFVVRDPVIESHVQTVAEALRPFGPCNFQLRVRAGVPYIFDINPRCSGTTYCRTLAGFNEPLMTLDFLERGTPPSYEIRPISIFRYWKELVVENHQIENVRRTGRVEGRGRRL